MPKKEPKERILSEKQKIIIMDMMKKVKVNHIFSKQNTYLLKFIFFFLDIKTDFKHEKPI